MNRANIRTSRERCSRECSRTHWDRTPSSDDDVRRCEHGRIWWCTPNQSPFSTIRRWEPLSRFWTPIKYRRAVRALSREVTE